MARSRGTTRTGGRNATLRHIPGDFALAVGMPPNANAPGGWRWVPLTEVARMESGHTPSRRHPEYWGGDVPWIGIKDAKAHHGQVIADTLEHINQLGLANSSARLLPADTVCLSRTASVGYVTVMGRPMATSQDFVSWICSEHLLPDFLKYLLLAEHQALFRFASGAVHQTIYYPEAKALHICLPAVSEQKRIVAILDEAFAGIAAAAANAEKNLASARELFESQLNSVFTRKGEGWVEVRLKDACSVFADGDWIETKDQSPSGIRLIQTGNVGVGEFKNRKEKARYISKRTFARLKCQDVIPGDCLISRLPDPVGRSCIVPETGARMLTAVDCTIIRFADGGVLSMFFNYYSRSSSYLADVDLFCTGSTRKRISRKNLGKITVPHPPTPEQERLVAELDELRVETQRLESTTTRKLAALAELKQSILRKAFAGELTAAAAEREAAA